MGNRHSGTHDSARYIDWLDKAEDDLYSALLLKDMNGDNSNAAFHCQQCIEKALKAYILFRQNKHVDGHNLTYLCRCAVKQDEKFREWLDESTELNRYYVETRYPSDEGFEVSDKQLEKIYKMAGDMFAFINGDIRNAEKE